MYLVEQQPFPEEFHRAWNSARQHLDQFAGPGLQWLRAWLLPPVAEHLAFRMGNQIVFIFVEVDDGWTFDPGRHRVFLDAAAEANAVPCLMPMRSRGGSYAPVIPAWGLKHAVTGSLVDPVALVSDELVEMTNWEVHDLAIQVVRDRLHAEGKRHLAWQSSLGIDPSLWFEDEEGPAWVVVRAARGSEMDATAPDNIDAIRQTLAHVTSRGFLASVEVTSADEARDPGSSPAPLYRGHAMNVRFEALRPL